MTLTPFQSLSVWHFMLLAWETYKQWTVVPCWWKECYPGFLLVWLQKWMLQLNKALLLAQEVRWVWHSLLFLACVHCHTGPVWLFALLLWDFEAQREHSLLSEWIHQPGPGLWCNFFSVWSHLVWKTVSYSGLHRIVPLCRPAFC